MVRRKQQTAPAGLRLITSEKCEPLVKQLHTIFLLEPTCIRVDRVTFTLNMWRIYMRLLVYTGKTPLYNASVKGDILLHMTVYMWGLRGRYFLTIIEYIQYTSVYYNVYTYSTYMYHVNQSMSHVLHHSSKLDCRSRPVPDPKIQNSFFQGKTCQHINHTSCEGSWACAKAVKTSTVY